jgi:hypothetical protein
MRSTRYHLRRVGDTHGSQIQRPRGAESVCLPVDCIANRAISDQGDLGNVTSSVAWSKSARNCSRSVTVL